MANTTYRYFANFGTMSWAQKQVAYERTANALMHFAPLQLNLLSLTATATYLEIVLSNPLPEEQRAHLGLTLM